MYFAKDYTDKDAMEFLTKTVEMTIDERRKSKEAGRYNDLLKLMLESRAENIDD